MIKAKKKVAKRGKRATAAKKSASSRTSARGQSRKSIRPSARKRTGSRKAKATTVKKKVTATKRQPAKKQLAKKAKVASGSSQKKRIPKKVMQKKSEKPLPQPAPPFIDPDQTIPEHGGMHPVSNIESHRAEQDIQRREESAMRQENQKVKNVLASRKNLKRTYRMYGDR